MVFISPSKKLRNGCRKLLAVDCTNSFSAFPMLICVAPVLTRALPKQKSKFNNNSIVFGQLIHVPL